MATDYQKKIDKLESIIQELSGEVMSERVKGMRELVRELDGCTEADTDFCEMGFNVFLNDLKNVAERGAEVLQSENRVLA